MQGKNLLLTGFLLVVAGFVFPLLMTVRAIPSSYWLSFLSFGASISGVLLGLIGAAYYARRRRD